MSSVDETIIKRIVRNLISSDTDDYREEVVKIIDEQFLQFTLDFFKNIAAAKIDNQTITALGIPHKEPDEKTLDKRIEEILSQ